MHIQKILKNIILNKSYILVLLIFVSCNINFVIAGEDVCKTYYSKLSNNDCEEMLAIYSNYSFYDSQLKEISLLRIKEIKYELYSNRKKIDIILNAIHSTLSNKKIEDKIKKDIVQYTQNFNKLNKNIKKELVGYAMNNFNNNKLSSEAKIYLDNKPKLVLK